MQQVPPLVGVVQFVEQRWGALLVTKKHFHQSICTLNKTKVLGHKIKTPTCCSKAAANSPRPCFTQWINGVWLFASRTFKSSNRFGECSWVPEASRSKLNIFTDPPSAIKCCNRNNRQSPTITTMTDNHDNKEVKGV